MKKKGKRTATGAETVRVRAKDAAESNARRNQGRVVENPKHREDFDRLLGGMARSSE